VHTARAVEIHGTRSTEGHLILLVIRGFQMSNKTVAGCFFGIAFAWCLLLFGILDYAYR
jgi:hypothetical protein